MKYLRNQVANYFDEFKKGINDAWLEEYNRCAEASKKGEKVKFEISNVLKSQPSISFERFDKMFTEAEDRIMANNKQVKKGLFKK